MLNRFFNSYLWVGIIIYCLLIVTIGDTFTWTSFVGFLALLISGSCLIYFSNREDDFFRSIKLAEIVFVYSVIFVSLFYLVSDYYDNDLYLFNKNDAVVYEKLSKDMASTTLEKSILLLKATYKSFDDWGAPYVMSTVLRIYPSKLFLNLFYICLGTFGALYLYGMGKFLMSNKMAFMASFAYSTSSFALYFHGTFLKESIFLFLVIGAFYHFYKFIEHTSLYHIIITIIFSLSILFFRPAVSMFFWIGVTTYFLTDKNNKIITTTALFILLLSLVLGAATVVQVFDKYTMGGDLESLLDTKQVVISKQFDYVINWIAAFIGPFPTLLSISKHSIVLYGSGLYMKMILFLPFFLGVIYIIRYKIRELYPMVFFCLIEIVSLAMILQAFELRKGLPHYPGLFIIAFWYIDVIDEETILFKKLVPIWLSIVVVVVLGWNILRA
ncbi:MAG: glycosyltransferase family 39 protein [Bacilli bacterium]|nr:glycosyltransferase family 39 protein [Bacilli bacterium]